MLTQLLCKIFFLQIGQSSFQKFLFFCIFFFPFLCFVLGGANKSSVELSSSEASLVTFDFLSSSQLFSESTYSVGVYLLTFCKFLLFPLPLHFFLSCSLNSLQLFSESMFLLLLILVMLFYSLQSEIKRQLRLFVVSRDFVTNSLRIAANVHSLWHWCMPQVAVCRHIFINIFQIESFSVVKFAMGCEKNVSFLVIPKYPNI